MPIDSITPVLLFVCRPQDVDAGTLDRLSKTGCGAVFDLAWYDYDRFSDLLLNKPVKDLKLSTAQVMDPGLENHLTGFRGCTVWVEYHPFLFPDGPASFLDRLTRLSRHFEPVVITGDPAYLRQSFGKEYPGEAIALKGFEASGFVSPETTAVLFEIMQNWQSGRSPKRDIFLWGGISTAEGAAAFCSSGAKGIVFESLHWSTSAAAADEAFHRKLIGLQAGHSSVVGLDIGVPGRFFDKGNSRAVRRLQEQARLCTGRAASSRTRADFAEKVQAEFRHPFEAGLTPDQLVPLGPEAAFAGLFAQRFGTDFSDAVRAFRGEIVRLCRNSSQTLYKFTHSPAAQEMGTRYPFIQGAMSMITDIPAFALAVSDAGGLPTFAVGFKERRLIEEEAGLLKKVLGERPFAVNLITLPENYHLKEQLAWLYDYKPPFVVISAGDPGYAADLLGKGMQVIYVASDEQLLLMALQAGVRFIVCEGHEAGGHVGNNSTLTLAQSICELRRRNPELFAGKYIALAGGICNRGTGFRAAMLGADMIQMGTSYLATREIVATGALHPAYQKLVLETGPAGTVLSGGSVGLNVRALKTPKVERIRELEHTYRAENGSETVFRQKLEEMSAGSLLAAARGVSPSSGEPLVPDDILSEGQFMCGAAAGIIDHAQTIEMLHQDVASGDFQPAGVVGGALNGAEKGQPILKRDRQGGMAERVAITGMAITNALGNNYSEVWRQSLALKSGITEVPPERWDHSLYYDPKPGVTEKTYCKVGAFQSVDIDRKKLGIAPQDFRTMSNSTRLTLSLADQALADAGLLDADIPAHRIGVLISQNSGECGNSLIDLTIGLEVRNILRTIREIMPLTPEKEKELERLLRSGRLTVDDTTLLGRLNCAAGGFICNKYGFNGPSYSVSAACATGLVALHSAIQMVKTGLLDAAVVGGGEEQLNPAHYLEFSSLGALAGLKGLNRLPGEWSRPFDADRDGMVLGEGGAMVIIERESVAARRNARIHAFITGIGGSNNDQGMVESLALTQKLAMQEAFTQAGYGGDEVDMVECHATATVQGDVEEVAALKSFYPAGSNTVLASFKSQIGHTLGASGLSSLIRGVSAMNAGIYPATLNYQVPDPDIGLESWGFRLPAAQENWHRPAHRPRRFQVDAFGFGGGNYVVQLEEHQSTDYAAAHGLTVHPGQVGLSQPAGPQSRSDLGVSFLNTELNGRTFRAGAVGHAPGALATTLSGLATLETGGGIPPRQVRDLERRGIFVSPADAVPGPLSLVFAGQGTFYQGMGRELYRNFNQIRYWMDLIAGVAEFDILDLLFNSREEDIQKTRWQQPALFLIEHAIARQLLSLGVRPAAMAGHSLGELTALCIAGVFTAEDGFKLVNKRAQCMDRAAAEARDPGAMIAVDAPREIIDGKIARSENLYITNFNSPRQLVIGGGTADISSLQEDLDKAGHWTVRLRVSMAFHSPLMKTIHDEMQAFIETIAFNAPAIPVISNTTCRPFPDDADRIKKIVMAHLESPVHWLQNVQSLRDDYGAGLFVEIGPKDTLCNLINDTLDDIDCIPTCFPDNEAETFRKSAARLYSLGHIDPGREVTVISPGMHKDVPKGPSASYDDSQVLNIIQQGINDFALNGVEKFLKPALLANLRRQTDPEFSMTRLERLLSGAMPANASLPGLESVSELPGPGPAADQTVRDPEPLPQQQLDGEEQGPAGPVKYAEHVIQIIMDATGYERDEIELDMDLRQDLTIRSSRLPVIVDAAERLFDIAIEVEDFIDVRTVRDIAETVERIIVRQGKSPFPEQKLTSGRPIALEAGDTQPEYAARKDIRRLVFEEAPLISGIERTLTIKPGQNFVLLTIGAGPRSAAVEEYFQKEHRMKARQIRVEDLIAGDASDEPGLEAALRDRIGDAGLSGLVVVFNEGPSAQLASVDQIPLILTACFHLLKNLLSSDTRNFGLLIAGSSKDRDLCNVAFEGISGMLLAAAHEYASMLFRSIFVDAQTPVGEALDYGLRSESDAVRIIYHDHKPHTVQAGHKPQSLEPVSPLELTPTDQILIAGGGRGITSYLARSLAPFGCRVVLLGRTVLDDTLEYGSFIKSRTSVEEEVLTYLNRTRPDLKGGKLNAASREIQAGLDITRTLDELAGLGVDARYFTCDVTDSARVAEFVGQLTANGDRIDGIVFGSGIIRDAFLRLMTTEDFDKVLKTKLLGAWNLYREAAKHGLRFMVGLSSVAAALGNTGQANYCAGNRAMAAMIRNFSRESDLIGKTLWLPPIEGAGMAEDVEVKEILKLKSMEDAFIQVSELAEIFNRELILADKDEDWIMPVRSLPPSKYAPVSVEGLEDNSGEGPGAGVAREAQSVESAGFRFIARDFPMVDSIERLDLAAGYLETKRTLSLAHDLWLADHRPFTYLKHPLVSAIMAVENFLEAAQVLYPYLNLKCIRQVEFLEILECPSQAKIETRTICRRLGVSSGEVVCGVELQSRDMSPTGRRLEHWSSNFRAQVVLGISDPSWSDQPYRKAWQADSTDGMSLSPDEVISKYENKTLFLNRYRVIEKVSGVTPDSVSGTMIYRQDRDFSHGGKPSYQYSPYLLEGLMQIIGFHDILQEEKGQEIIPARIGEIHFSRLCREGEPVNLHAAIREENGSGKMCDSRAYDASGQLIMQAAGIRMRWFTQ